MPTAASPAPRRALVVANPTAGTVRAGLFDEVVRLCRDRLDSVEVHRTTHRGSATEAVRAATAADLVIAVGGDGTVREVVEGLVARDRPTAAALAVVPAGTGNSNYRMLWADRPWAETLQATLTADAERAALRRIDLGSLAETGELVLLGACSGLVAEGLITARTVQATGRERYTRALPDAAAAHRPYPGRVTVDGTVLHEGATVLANVGGGRYRGGQYLVLPHSELDDGLLDVCVVGAEVPATDIPHLAIEGLLHEQPGVVYGRGRRVVVERLDGRPLCFEHDGELQQLNWTSMSVDVLPGVLPVWGAPTKEVTRVDTQGAVPVGGPAAG
ncbi:diacylglycerol/lipid kinase family protein [Streptomyces sp. NBC_01766]|uniref:diacylglycerol/lipid kinase family protein n=1 Tax=Streptomyces sp. NBC_01766 TaxID=2975936 RepID=UPI002DDACCF2|nr:diacylglycerol kinase family protein [Streptomyces sp. NBC_01766]WSC25211.1 diacylglycerol kinase family protein [Streptomyces sp. NBC_01766]